MDHLNVRGAGSAGVAWVRNLAIGCVGFAAVAVSGCSAPSAGGSLTPPAGPVSLAGPVHVTATSAPASGTLNVTVVGGVGPTEKALALPLESADVALQTTATWAGLTELRVPMGDISVAPPAMPPSGLQLRQLVMSLHSSTPVAADVTASSSDVLDLHAKVGMALDWKLELADGTLQPLGALDTNPLALDADVVRDADGNVSVHVHGSCEGTCGSVTGVVALDNATFDLTVPATSVVAAE